MSASDTARPERSGRVFLHGLYKDKISMNYQRGNAEAVAFPRLCCKSLFVYLRSPHMTKRDPVVADIAPSADTLPLTTIIHSVNMSHASSAGCNMFGNRGAQGGSFLTVNLECRGQ